MALASAFVAAIASTNERAHQFAASLEQPNVNLQNQLIDDAKLNNSRTFVPPSAWHVVTKQSPSLTDYLLFRRYCDVTFTTSERIGNSFSSFNCTNSYVIGLFDIRLVESNDEWAMTVH